MTIIKTFDPILEETIYKKIHESGLEMYFMQKKDYMKKYAYFGTKYGAFHNEFEFEGKTYDMPLGIAHFLEHKIFEDKDRSIFDTFSKLGASVNAYTNYNSTVYNFSTVENFDECLKTLLSFVQNVHLTEENVEKEKDIIVQELKSYEDDPEYMIFFNVIKNMYKDHPIKNDIGGTEDSVRNTTMEQLFKCYEAFYTPSNMMVYVAGDLEPEEVFSLIESSLTPGYLSKKDCGKLMMPIESSEVLNREIIVDYDVATPMFELALKNKHNCDNDTEGTLKISMALKIALDAEFGKASETYNMLYEKGYTNSTFSMEFSCGNGYSFTIFGGESTEIEKVKEIIFDKITKIKEEGINEESFNRIKKKLIGKFISASNSPAYLASSFINFYMKGTDMFEYLKLVNEVDLEYANNVFRDTYDTYNTVMSRTK
jgi:predicted Zn-dependent peptidase